MYTTSGKLCQICENKKEIEMTTYEWKAIASIVTGDEQICINKKLFNLVFM